MTRDTGLTTAVTYLPSDNGVYLWHGLDRARVGHDMTAITGLRFDAVRLLLSWDVFLASRRGVNRAALGRFEGVLRVAQAAGLSVIPVVGPQAVGGCVLLPRHMLISGGRSSRVRVICDQHVEKGSPRDAYTDPLMLEAQMGWLDALLSGFANHPAIAAWDLGNDPASAMRPRRLGDLGNWTRLLAGRIHAAGDRVWMTLGSRDLTQARAVRPAQVAAQVDVCGFELWPHALGFDAPGEPRSVGFLTSLAQRLCAEAPVAVMLGAARGSAEPAPAGRPATSSGLQLPDQERERWTAGALDHAVAAGAVAVCAAAWSDMSRIPARTAPYDREPGISHAGVVDAEAELTTVGRAWRERNQRDRSLEPPTPWPAQLDEEAFYSNLPDSLRDLHASWQSGEGWLAPGIVE